MAARQDELFLLGRNLEDLGRSAADLEAFRGEGEVGTAHCDLLDRTTAAPALEAAEKALDGLDTVVVTAGLFADQPELEEDAEVRDRVLTANFTGTIHFSEEARRRLLDRGGGTLCVFGSVAGDRARKPVIIYGATKAGLAHYLNGLDHRYRREGLRVVLVKPGFVKTGMTAGLAPPPFAGEPEAVAARILRAIDRGRPVVYAPAVWGAILWVIRHLPRAVMRRIGF
jgi:short-subunit dehydrogenase